MTGREVRAVRLAPFSLLCRGRGEGRDVFHGLLERDIVFLNDLDDEAL